MWQFDKQEIEKHSGYRAEKEVCRLKIMTLLNSKLLHYQKICGTEALKSSDTVSRNIFYEMIECIEDWRIKYALLKFWILSRKGGDDMRSP